MANFDTIKTAIDANIKTNGTQDITGGKMNSILHQMVDATDEQLTELEQRVIYDVSANANGATFASLSALFSSENLSTLIPTTVRCGGMSIRFVQSSDNKYVQYRLTADEWSTNTEDWSIADEGVYVENPEFVYVKTDKDNKILWAIKTDGSIYYGAGVPQQVKDYIEEKISSLSLDEYEDIVAFLSDYLGSDTTLKIMIDSINERIPEIIENPEYIETKTDSEGKVLAGRTSNGEAFENVGFNTPKMSIDGHTIENIEDQEGRTEITTDGEGKVLSYRKKDGTKCESVGIETEKLTLSEEGMTEFQKALKASGFTGGQGDWSDLTELHIAEPKCARVNFTGISELPQAKFLDVHGYMEFCDMQGNYFRKQVILNAQGDSSMLVPKKNIAVDICNNNGWDDDDTFKLQIGKWVPQDSFHLKAYYTDPFRCIGAISYKLYNEMIQTRGELNDYFWKRALIDFSTITTRSNGTTTLEETKATWNTGARCVPDGFPCIVYLNGEFYGIFSWQLKKHRDNYHMDKKTADQIHLDGVITGSSILDANGDPSLIGWDATDKVNGFEIRNPKSLYLMNGTKYDADFNPGELIDDTSENYDANNKDHKRSAKVKKYILDLSKVKTIIGNAKSVYDASEKTESDKETFKAVFETYFDVNNLIDYAMYSDIAVHWDGFGKNWQWLTYDGVKWYIGLYDCDNTFGNVFYETDYIETTNDTHADLGAYPFSYLWEFYDNEAKLKYAELRNKKIIDRDHIVNLVNTWIDNLGSIDTFEKEWNRWPEFIKNDSIHRLYKWVTVQIRNMDTLYEYSQN